MHALRRTSPLRRVVLTSAATVSGLVLLLSLKPHSAPEVGPAVPSGGSHASSGSGDAGGSGSVTTTGTVTGEQVQTRYGPVQVRITLRNGRLTEVTAVALPRDNPRDREISGYAVPRLTREALAAQSAEIDTVSGATYTSEGYRRSLQSALDSARG
ncbi:MULTISPECIES: FMN-binding protein [Streptomyces]|uniref:FMN-binding protein n=1 Tax=Streptomyces nodosus TaxID=40318 RepID=A0A0B5DH79_9ACTN|nr:MULTISPECIES: FMN-binding protein [Streptomyces]AJE39806.1 FMN-binding protein [Streptomyces nodosus]MYV49553.1 FMN-binding protein [Streptomyces sp. SID2888]QEV38398.1 FMN-binding protein [Streptomyces nodosus]